MPTPTPTTQAPPTPQGQAGPPVLDFSNLPRASSSNPPLLRYRTGPINLGSAPLPDSIRREVEDGKVESTLDDAKLEFYSWSFKQQQDFAKELYEKNLIQSPYDLSAAQGVWEDVVKAATNYYAAGNPLTPEEILDNAAALKKIAADPKSVTSVNTAVNVMGEAEAKQLVRSIFQQGVGRDPTSDELEMYANQVVSASEEKASVTTMTQTKNSTGGVDTDTVSMPGYTAADAREAIQTGMERDPEYGIYQAATTYWNALEDL